MAYYEEPTPKKEKVVMGTLTTVYLLCLLVILIFGLAAFLFKI